MAEILGAVLGILGIGGTFAVLAWLYQGEREYHERQRKYQELHRGENKQSEVWR